jgi:hypothetical protein
VVVVVQVFVAGAVMLLYQLHLHGVACCHACILQVLAGCTAVQATFSEHSVLPVAPVVMSPEVLELHVHQTPQLLH